MQHDNPIGERLHYIPEWAAHCGFEGRGAQTKLREALEAIGAPIHKGTISRWFAGKTRSRLDPDHEAALLVLFGLEDRESLYRHPSEDWLTRFFRERATTEADKLRAQKILEKSFPKRA